MNVNHIVRDLDIASGGPSRSVPALAQSQSLLENVTVQVLFRDRGNPMVPVADSAVEYKSFHGDLKNSAAYSGRDGTTVLHLHGLWSPNLHRAARIAHKHTTPYVVSTRGMLANWALGHKALKKKIAWKLYQQRDLENAAGLVASSELERRDTEVLLPGSRAVVIPNGCDPRPDIIAAHHALPMDSNVRWALAMGRLHPVKGYAELIAAWAAVRPAGWQLGIAGPDEDGYRATLEALIMDNGLKGQVHLLGEVDDTLKWSLLDQAELFLAPSKTENFGMAIAEALQSGTPVITTKGTPWRELTEQDCGWWIDHGSQALEKTLAEASAYGAEVLRAKGGNGHRLIREKYTWERVAASTIELYRSLLKGKKQ